MKNLVFKVLRGFFYFLGFLFITIIVSTIHDGGSLIYGMFGLFFGASILPYSYKKINNLITKQFKNISKTRFTIYYILIVFFGYFLSFGLLSGSVVSNQVLEKQLIEDNTTLSVEYGENSSYTLKDELELKITQKNIKSIDINGKEINIQGDTFIYKYPLMLGKNTISIIGYNGEIKRELNKEIDRITKEDEQKRIVMESKRIEEEKQKVLADQVQKEELAKKQVEIQEQERIKTIIDRLNKEIISIDKYNGTSYRDSVANIQIEVALFSAFGGIIQEYSNESNSEVKKILNQYKTKVSNLQKREFPKIRKAYADLVGKTMWEYNIDVIAKGTSYSTIEFIGGLYANNKNIKDSYILVRDVLKLLRFDRANFKWYKYDEEYTYYAIESLSDDKIEGIK